MHKDARQLKRRHVNSHLHTKALSTINVLLWTTMEFHGVELPMDGEIVRVLVKVKKVYLL